MRTYETVFVLNPELSAEAQTEQIEFYKENITKNGGEIIKADSWGKLTLAYKIENHSEGIYILIQFNAATDYVAELERRYKYNEDVLRYIVVMIDGKKFKLEPRKDPIKRERKPRRQDEQSEEVLAEGEEFEALEAEEQPEQQAE